MDAAEPALAMAETGARVVLAVPVVRAAAVSAATRVLTLGPLVVLALTVVTAARAGSAATAVRAVRFVGQGAPEIVVMVVPVALVARVGLPVMAGLGQLAMPARMTAAPVAQAVIEERSVRVAPEVSRAVRAVALVQRAQWESAMAEAMVVTVATDGTATTRTLLAVRAVLVVTRELREPAVRVVTVVVALAV